MVRPTGNAKLKVELASGDKGQPLLPSNCIRVHSDKARFLEYQKQVLQAYIERMYSKSWWFQLFQRLVTSIDLAGR